MYIRPYRHSDFETIASWWTDRDSIPPQRGMLVEDGTFVVEGDNGEPLMSQTVLCTQSKDICILEFFCKTSREPQSIPRGLEQVLWKHCYGWAKDRGYKYMIGYSQNEKVCQWLDISGMHRSLGNLQSFWKEL